MLNQTIAMGLNDPNCAFLFAFEPFTEWIKKKVSNKGGKNE